jgi:hypothetical protein
MYALFVAFLLISPTLETSLVACDRVLMCLQASLVIASNYSTNILVRGARSLLLPAQRQIGSGDNLDKIHVVERFLSCFLLGVVQRVDVVVGPATRASCRRMFLEHVLYVVFTQLGAKTKVMNLVGEGMRILVFEEVFKVMYVKIAIGEGLSGSDVEVSNNLVHLDVALETAPLLALLVEMLGVVLAFTLLNALATTERPRYGGIRIAYFVAGVAAVGLLCIGGGWSAVALATVVGGKMRCFVLMSAAGVSLGQLLPLSYSKSDVLTDPEPWSRFPCYHPSQGSIAPC